MLTLMKKNLVLIGMMGSGKSTIGKILAKESGLNFFDIDKLIEEEFNLKIVDIFKIKGESFFRKNEEKITLKTLKLNNNIIALGGGAFLNDRIRSEVLKKDISVWLSWNNETLIARIKNSKKRPIANILKKKDLIKMIEKRSKIYSMAKYKINCNKLGKKEIVEKILNLYEE